MFQIGLHILLCIHLFHFRGVENDKVRKLAFTTKIVHNWSYFPPNIISPDHTQARLKYSQVENPTLTLNSQKLKGVYTRWYITKMKQLSELSDRET